MTAQIIELPADAARRIPVPARAERREDGHAPRRQLSFLHMLDTAASVTPEVDSDHVAVSNREARRLLGLSRGKLRRLVAAGVLSSPAHGLVTVPRSRPLASVFGDWATACRPDHTRRAVLAFADARDICGARAADLPPDPILAACGAVLRQAGGTHRSDELAALLRVPPKTAAAAAARLAELTGTGADDGNDPLAAPLTMEMVVAAVPALAGAKRTCLDPEPDDFYEEPGLRSRARLAATGAVLPPAALFAMVASASMRREERLEHHMLMAQRFGRLLPRAAPGSGHGSPEAIRDTLEYVAFSPELDGEISPGVRDMICRTWLMLTDVNTRYVRAADPDGSKGMAALVPARHPEETDFRARLRAHFKPLREAAREKRKAKSDPLADHLSDHCDRFWNRMVEIGEICEAARAAAAELLDPVRPRDEPYVEFLVTIAPLDGGARRLRGGPDGHLQEERWRAWLEDDFRASMGLGPALADQPNLPVCGDVSPTVQASKPIIIYERVGARAVRGGRTTKPFVATISDCGVLARPAGLDRRTLRMRHSYLKIHRLPAPSSFPEGLMWFDEPREDLWRRARARGRSIVPLEELGTGMLFPELGLNAVLESLCRGNAFMQMEQTLEAWPTDDSMPTHAGLCFAAIDKTPAGRDPEFAHFPVCDQTLVDAMELAGRVAAAAGREDGVVPDVLIDKRYRWKRPNPRPFIFQWNGRALTLSEVARMLRVLLAGIADVSFHDFRHACAADLFDITSSPEILQRALGQTTGIWRYYARRTARMERREQRRRQQERSAALADKTAMRRAA